MGGGEKAETGLIDLPNETETLPVSTSQRRDRARPRAPSGPASDTDQKDDGALNPRRSTGIASGRKIDPR